MAASKKAKSSGDEIKVRFDSADKVHRELEALSACADEYASIELSLDTSQGPARDKLIEIAEALSTAARELSAMIQRTAVKVDEAKISYQGADEKAARGMSGAQSR